MAGSYNGADLELDVTTDTFTSITVERRDQNHPHASGTASAGAGWGIYWTITPVGAGVVTLTLPVAFTPGGGDSVCRYNASVDIWYCRADSFTTDPNTITRQGVSTFSDWAAGQSAPLAVPLEALRGIATPAGAVIAWETTNELAALGYFVQRAAETGGAWVRLNEQMIASQGPGSPAGYSYRWTDATARRGAAYRYRVAAVGLDGGEMPLDSVSVTTPWGWYWLPAAAQ